MQINIRVLNDVDDDDDCSLDSSMAGGNGNSPCGEHPNRLDGRLVGCGKWVVWMTWKYDENFYFGKSINCPPEDGCHRMRSAYCMCTSLFSTETEDEGLIH